jgi:membrane protein YdbS with pleckstrin-like domain
MGQEAIVVRKSPYLFLKWVVTIEFFFAILPFLAAALVRLRESYDSTAVSGTVSYTLLVAVVLTTLQVLIIGVSFVAWYFPVYHADKVEITLRRANLFEDRMLVRTPAIASVTLRQGWLARKLDYGTLVIETTESPDKVRIRDIPNPSYHAQLIENLVGPTAYQASKEPRPVQALIDEGEGQYVEFKSSLMWDYRREIVNKDLYEPVMKNVVGFMNARGGTVLIGVADDGSVLGLDADLRSMRKPDSDGFENVFNMAFRQMIGVEFRRFVDVAFPEVNGKQVCAVIVRPSSQPAYLTYKGAETFYIRAGNASQPLTVSRATRYIREHFKE